MANYATEQHSYRRAGRPRRVPARPRWPRRCCSQAGAIEAAGSVERGTTVSDFDPLEKQ